VNLIQELMDVLKSAQTSSVTDIAIKFDHVIDPIARTFTTIDTFIDYLKASLQLEVIRQRIKQRGARGRAWRKAHDYLRDAGVSGVAPEDENKSAAAADSAPPHLVPSLQERRQHRPAILCP